MTLQAFRLQNFMCFEDSGWIEWRPLTLFYGRNSAGKSAIFRALLLLQQSLTSQPDSAPLIFALDDGFDFGSYSVLVRDHDISHSISFWFRCVIDQEQDAPKVAAMRGLGVEGTSIQVRLSYQLANQKVALHSLTLYDEQEELIWQATKQGSGEEWRFEADFLANCANVWRETVLTISEGFFPKLHAPEPLGKEVVQLQQFLCHLEGSIYQFFKTLQYVGPMRAKAERFYDLSKENNGQFSNGQRLIRALLASDTKRMLSRINEWLAEFGLQMHLELTPLASQSTVHQLLLSDPLTKTIPLFQANIREVGFGISQLLPVIVESLLLPENSTLLLEQPELHLAPGIQSELADLLIDVAVQQKVRLLVETHSENLLIRVRRRLAESNGRDLLPEDKGYLPHEALRTYFVHKEAGKSEVRRLYIGPIGEMSLKPFGYKGFFSSDLRDTVALTKAQLGR